MSKTYNPTSHVKQLTPQDRTWVQSAFREINGSLNLGVPTGSNPMDSGVNAGVYTQFDKGNGSGVLVRVAANGSLNTGALYNWPASGSLTIDHALGRKPIGFHVVDSDRDVRVFRTSPPTKTQLILQPTDPTASVTLYVF